MSKASRKAYTASTTSYTGRPRAATGFRTVTHSHLYHFLAPGSKRKGGRQRLACFNCPSILPWGPATISLIEALGQTEDFIAIHHDPHLSGVAYEQRHPDLQARDGAREFARGVFARARAGLAQSNVEKARAAGAPDSIVKELETRAATVAGLLEESAGETPIHDEVAKSSNLDFDPEYLKGLTKPEIMKLHPDLGLKQSWTKDRMIWLVTDSKKKDDE
jgi:hypothetical protein